MFSKTIKKEPSDRVKAEVRKYNFSKVLKESYAQACCWMQVSMTDMFTNNSLHSSFVSLFHCECHIKLSVFLKKQLNTWK